MSSAVSLVSPVCHPVALKVLVASELGSCPVTLHTPEQADPALWRCSLGGLPVVRLSSGVVLFSPSAAVRSLLAACPDPELDVWLRWDGSVLQPLTLRRLQAAFGERRDAAAATALSAALQKLSDAGPLPAQAEAVVWATLHPLLALDGGKHVNVPAPLQERLTQTAASAPCRTALKRLYGEKGVEAGKAAVMASSVPVIGVESSAAGPAATAASQTSTEKEEEDVALSQGEVDSAVKAFLTGPTHKPLPAVTPVLPKKGERNVLITSALPYVNNVPHLGNIIGCVLSADVFARFCRLRGYNTLYVCGTDEYGTATETKALQEGLTPEQICDKYNKLHTEVYDWFGISFDHFGRTTTAAQTEVAQDIFKAVHENGFTLEDAMEQLFCEKCDRFLADRFVEGICPLCGYEDARGDQCDKCGKLINAIELKQPRCKLCTAPPEVRSSRHVFLDLPKVEAPLRAWFKQSSPQWTPNARVIGNSWLRDGLKPRCITRDLRWGTPVPLPGYEDKVFYVWFDAPIGYLSITKSYTEEWKQWWIARDQVQYYQFMAKDNVPFHAVVFPACQIASGTPYTMVTHLMATEYLNYEDGKFSKSRGVGVFGNDARDTGIPADIWRFYLLYVRPEHQDAAFSWADLTTKNNSELLNNLGNFINRCLTFCQRCFNGIVPELQLEEQERQLIAHISRELRGYLALLEAATLRDAIRLILNISRRGNQYMQANQPWVLVKGSEAEKRRAGTVISLCVNISCLLSVMLQPYMPHTSETIQRQLAAPADVNVLGGEFVCALPAGHRIGTPAPLFEKIGIERADELRKKYQGQQQTATPGGGGDRASLEQSVANQGDVVRKLKASKAPKEKIAAEVKILLDLKKRLAAAPVPKPAADGALNGGTAVDAAQLEQEVAKQGDVVRKLKASKAPKEEISAQVAILLDLKSRLAAAAAPQVAPPAPSGTDPAEVARLTAEVARQADHVRQLKTSGAAKDQVTAQVSILLDLKKQLAAADPSQAAPPSGKKGKKK